MTDKKTQLQGFSLAEVMIIFTILAAILVASVTLITKKTAVIPPKVSHGVYRCIYYSDYDKDKLHEELYNGKKQVWARNDVASCSFKVPKAAMYKVDIYSAGSGGNLAARITPSHPSYDSTEPDPSNPDPAHSVQIADYTVDNITNDEYHASINELFPPTDDDFYKYLNGNFIVQSVYTGDAGFGGGINFSYQSVYDSSCIPDGGADVFQEQKERLERIKATLEKMKVMGHQAGGYRYFTKHIADWSDFSPDVNRKGLLYGTTNYLWDLKVAWAGMHDAYEDNKFMSDQTIWNTIDSFNLLSVYSSKDEFVAYNREICPDYQQVCGSGGCEWVSPPPYGYSIDCSPDDGFVHVTNFKDNDPKWGIKKHEFNKLYLKGAIALLYSCENEDLCEGIHYYADDEHSDASYVNTNMWDLVYLIATTLLHNSDMISDISEVDTRYDGDIVPVSDIQEALEYMRSEESKFSFQQVVDPVWNFYKENKLNDDNHHYLNYDDGGGEDEYGSVKNLLYKFRRYDLQEHSQHQIMGTVDENGANDSWTWGVRFRDVVDDVIDYAIDYALNQLEIQLHGYEGRDLQELEAFVQYFPPSSIMPSDPVRKANIKQQIRDYCMLEFKPLYEQLGHSYDSPNIENEIDSLITFGTLGSGMRKVVKLGGNEGLGSYTRLIYKINYKKGTNKNSFKDYFSNLGKVSIRYCDKTYTDCKKASYDKINKGLDVNLKELPDYDSDGLVNAGMLRSLMYDDLTDSDFDDNTIEGSEYYYDGHNSGAYYSPQTGVLKIKMTAEGEEPKNSNTIHPNHSYIQWRIKNPTTGVTEKINAITSQAKGGKAIEFGIKDYGRKAAGTDYKYERSLVSDCNDFTTKWYCGYETTDGSGTGGEISFNDNNAIFIQGTQFRVLADRAYIQSDADLNGANVVTNSTTGTDYSVAGINISDAGNHLVTDVSASAGSPLKQTPSLKTFSWIWSKEYQIGANGKKGFVSSTTETDLGTNCTFNVAKPGPVHKRSDGISDEEYMNYLDYLKNGLSTTMTCTDKEGKVVFQKTVENPDGYNDIGLIGSGDGVSNAVYTWNREIDDNEPEKPWMVSPPEAENPKWVFTSIWSRLFNEFFTPDGVKYDITSKYGVGNAGTGTTISDKCLRRKGRYGWRVDYDITYPEFDTGAYGRAINPEKQGCEFGTPDECELETTFVKPTIKPATIEGEMEGAHYIYADGIYKGYNCYGPEIVADDDEDADEYDLTEDSPIVKGDVVSIEAGKGGGGAVVITW